jgi:hypothetical protein
MPLNVTVWLLTAMATAVFVDVAASQMLSLGTSLLLSHRQSPAGMALLLNDCGTACVSGDVPSGQTAAVHGSHSRTLMEQYDITPCQETPHCSLQHHTWHVTACWH